MFVHAVVVLPVTKIKKDERSFLELRECCLIPNYSFVVGSDLTKKTLPKHASIYNYIMPSHGCIIEREQPSIELLDSSSSSSTIQFESEVNLSGIQ